jgi:CubicO group peptidase (beta-lactamase class C family)
MNHQIVRSVFTAFLVLISLTINASDGQANNSGEFISKVDSLLASETVPNEPGAAVAVLQNGKVIYLRCFGLASLEYWSPITHETVFNLASVSKQFVALAILMLEKEGKINLDDDIHGYFPGLPDFGDTVTISNLLHHTSGLWEFSKIMYYYGCHDLGDRISIDDVLALLEGQDQLMFSPGSQWKYCNTNYALLAELVARVTGESFSAWTKTNIFDPLEMKNTLFRDDYMTLIPNLAGSYSKLNGVYKRTPTNGEVVGPSNLFSTIDDVSRWLDNYRTQKVGGKDLIERMFRKSKLNDGSENFYGYGLGVSEHNRKLTIDHSGQTRGFVSMVIYVPEDEIGIAILANDSRIMTESMGYRILDLLYDNREEDTHAPTASDKKPTVSLSSEEKATFEGSYQLDEAPAKLFVTSLKRGLYAIFDGLGSDVFYPLSDSQFANSAQDVTFIVSLDQDQGPTRVKLDLKGEAMSASYVVPPLMTTEELVNDYGGEYLFEPLGVVYKVVEDSGKLVLRNCRNKDLAIKLTDRDEFIGSIGIVRFSRDTKGKVTGFAITDEDTNFKPLIFRRIQ